MKYASTLAAMLVLGLGSNSASAEDGKLVATFGYLAVGTATPITDTHVFWSGHFSGSLKQDGGGEFDGLFVQCPGINDLNFGVGSATSHGYCMIGDASTEHRIIAKWECSGAPGSCSGTAEWIGGIGKWEGIRGSGTFTAQLGPSFSDGSTPGYAHWDIDYTTP